MSCNPSECWVYQERVGIMEHDGGLAQDDAEYSAIVEICNNCPERPDGRAVMPNSP